MDSLLLPMTEPYWTVEVFVGVGADPQEAADVAAGRVNAWLTAPEHQWRDMNGHPMNKISGMMHYANNQWVYIVQVLAYNPSQMIEQPRAYTGKTERFG